MFLVILASSLDILIFMFSFSKSKSGLLCIESPNPSWGICLKGTSAFSVFPDVDIMWQRSLSCDLHCLINYNLGGFIVNHRKFMMKGVPNTNLSERNKIKSIFSFSSSLRILCCEAVFLSSFFVSCGKRLDLWFKRLGKPKRRHFPGHKCLQSPSLVFLIL